MSARPDQCWLTSGRWYLNCDSCLIYKRVWMGNHIVHTVYQPSHIRNLERIWSWSIIDERPDGLLRGPDGCKLVQKLLDIVEGPDGKIRRPEGWCWSVWCPVGINTSSGRMEQWTYGCPDGMTRRLDGWQGIWNVLSFSQCRVFWKCSNKWNLCLQHLYT
jgi:hypothetical protein